MITSTSTAVDNYIARWKCSGAVVFSDDVEFYLITVIKEEDSTFGRMKPTLHKNTYQIS